MKSIFNVLQKRAKSISEQEESDKHAKDLIKKHVSDVISKSFFEDCVKEVYIKNRIINIVAVSKTCQSELFVYKNEIERSIEQEKGETMQIKIR